ncbi:MAG: short-chain dehydrogenase, partial [Burkholderiales bacterium PBB5]
MLPPMTLTTRLDGQRVLITQADTFMGPDLTEVFTRLGATVIGDTRALGDDPAASAAAVADAGHVDTLLLHLAIPAPSPPAQSIGAADWRSCFAPMVGPL